MLSPRPSLRDIARKLDVSHVTVSLALHDNPRISAICRQRVQKLAREMGYHPDPMLTSLIAYRQSKRVNPISATLGWLNRWPVAGDLRRLREFNAYWDGALSAAEQFGYRLEEFSVPPDLSTKRLQRILVTRAVRGLLIPPHPEEISWGDFALDWSQFALVRFGFSVPGIKIHMIGNDQMRSAELAVGRIEGMGYRRIGYVSSATFDRTTDGNFRVGYLRGVETMHTPVRIEPLLLHDRLTLADERTAGGLKRWLARAKPDAILTSEPELYQVLPKLGWRVPADIGLAATSVRDGGRIDAGLDQNPVEIGRVAVRTVIELVHGHERGIPEFCRRVLIEGRWVDGACYPRAEVRRI